MKNRAFLMTNLIVATMLVPTLWAADIPAHPRDLSFGELVFEVPQAEEYRHVLNNGVVVYVVEDHALPLVDINLTVRAGAFLEDEAEVGLSGLVGTMVRQGGTQTRSAEEYDEAVDFLAANISTSGGDTSSSASLDCLSSALDPSLDLFFELLTAPGFQQDRLEVVQGNLLEGMKQRNDDPRSIASREWSWLLRGNSHFGSRRLTEKGLSTISRDDLATFYRRYWRPDQMVIAISGDVETKSILEDLEQRLGEWPLAQEVVDVPWPPVPSSYVPQPGVYHVEKDIPQGRVSIGHLTSIWDDYANPQAYSAMVMNEILGGGGFTSRLVKRIRSDEGLAYSAGSGYRLGTYQPGTFTMSYQSKNPTVALAAKIALEEVARIQNEAVSDEEMRTAKASFIDTFPRRFESSGAVARTFASDEYVGRPHDYWYKYRNRIAAVDAASVQKAAQELLRPEGLVMLVVGPWDEVAPGDADNRAEMSEILDGEVHHLPLRDPLTLEPLE